ncbi:MAG: diaminopimelate epimerase [Corynebacteriales bacterium]|nr:diaminopimelate epimerase [Mycobacteriales bacterium]
MRFVKGHGTENDFVLLPDPDGEIKLDAELVKALCHRRAGIGADGVIRVVPAEREPEAAEQVHAAKWFMDYYNSDGSIGEMCGNGSRVFARYLFEQGWESTPEFSIATRAGVKQVRMSEDVISVDIGEATFGSATSTAVSGTVFPGNAVFTGNAHLVCVTDVPVDVLDLTVAPPLDAEIFPHGANVEFVNVISPTEVRMRVFERGSGETRSCGTGATAVGAWVLGNKPGSVTVHVPGGTLGVSSDGVSCQLSGPAVLIATGQWRGSQDA